MGLIWGTIITVFGLVGAIAIAVAGRLLSDDAKEWLPWTTRHLIERAVARLPENEREDRREEWTSDVNEWPGNLLKVYRAWGYLSAAKAIHHIAASMTPEHPRWDEFIDRLAGFEGCDFRESDDGSGAWTCDARDHTRPFCRSIMQHMGLSRGAIAASLAYFEEHGGYCDCEVLFNVCSIDPNLAER
jgi:Protein of unknown function (DUF2695)